MVLAGLQPFVPKEFWLLARIIQMIRNEDCELFWQNIQCLKLNSFYLQFDSWLLWVWMGFRWWSSCCLRHGGIVLNYSQHQSGSGSLLLVNGAWMFMALIKVGLWWLQPKNAWCWSHVFLWVFNSFFFGVMIIIALFAKWPRLKLPGCNCPI